MSSIDKKNIWVILMILSILFLFIGFKTLSLGMVIASGLIISSLVSFVISGGLKKTFKEVFDFKPARGLFLKAEQGQVDRILIRLASSLSQACANQAKFLKEIPKIEKEEFSVMHRQATMNWKKTKKKLDQDVVITEHEFRHAQTLAGKNGYQVEERIESYSTEYGQKLMLEKHQQKTLAI